MMESEIDTLTDTWRETLSAGDADKATFEAKVKALVPRVIAVRSARFEANATLQAERASDDPVMLAETDLNQEVIKRCTNLLSEMSAALGRSSYAG